MEQYYHIFDLLPVGIIITSPAKTILYINQEARELTGYENKEITGKRCEILFSSQCLAASKGCCFDNKTAPAHRALEIVTRNGNSVVVDKIEKLFYDDDGSLKGAIEMISIASKEDSMAVEIKRSNQRLSSYLSQLEDILDVGLMITSSLSVHRVLLRIINILRSTFSYETVFILIPNNEGQLEIAARTSGVQSEEPSTEKIDVENSSAQDSLNSKEAVLINDTAKEKQTSPFLSSSRSELFVPMLAQENKLGILVATSSKPHYFTKRDIDILTKIANFAAAALHNAQLTKYIKSARDQYETLFDKSSDPIMITSIDGDKFLDINVRAAEVYGYNKDEFLKMDPIQLIATNSKTDADRYRMFKSDWEGTHITKEKTTLYVETRTATIEYMNQKANQTIIRDISERKKFEEELRKLSITDELTQLYNRYFFLQTLQNEIARAKRYEHPLSLLMVDVDKFKPFNDKYGHLAGDKLLSDLGDILHLSLRSTDIPCRYGGDEFAIVLPHTPETDAEIIASRILAEYSKKKYSETGLSIGISSLSKDDTEETLIHKADQALYYVKKELGRGKIMLYQNIKG